MARTALLLHVHILVCANSGQGGGRDPDDPSGRGGGGSVDRLERPRSADDDIRNKIAEEKQFLSIAEFPDEDSLVHELLGRFAAAYKNAELDKLRNDMFSSSEYLHTATFWAWSKRVRERLLRFRVHLWWYKLESYCAASSSACARCCPRATP